MSLAADDNVSHSTCSLCVLVSSLALFFLSVWARYHNGLNAIPGPFLASISSLWKFKTVWCEDMTNRNTELHEKYGPLVRIGPNHISASSAEALHIIHRAKTGFIKAFPSYN